VSFVAVAKPLEGHPNGVLVQITVRAVAVPRRLVVLESSGHVLRTREPSFLWTVVGFAERRLSDTGSFRRCSGTISRAAAVLVLVALEQEGSLLGKGNTAVQGARVVAVLLRTGATSARTTAAGGAATVVPVVIVVAVVDRDQQLESVVKRGCGLVDEALFEAHRSVVVQFLSAKEMKTALLGGAHGISSGGSSSRSGSGR